MQMLPALSMLLLVSSDTARISACMAADSGGTEVKGDVKDKRLNFKEDREGKGRRALSMRDAAAKVGDDDDA